jgi:hypothetical protein
MPNPWSKEEEEDICSVAVEFDEIVPDILKYRVEMSSKSSRVASYQFHL